jgi:hypothetical protein
MDAPALGALFTVILQDQSWEMKFGACFVPVVIYGARQKLPAQRLLPAPGPLRVRICAPIDSIRFESARELMLATRRAMLAELDEPDLAPGVSQPRGAGEQAVLRVS